MRGRQDPRSIMRDELPERHPEAVVLVGPRCKHITGWNGQTPFRQESPNGDLTSKPSLDVTVQHGGAGHHSRQDRSRRPPAPPPRRALYRVSQSCRRRCQTAAITRFVRRDDFGGRLTIEAVEQRDVDVESSAVVRMLKLALGWASRLPVSVDPTGDR